MFKTLYRCARTAARHESGPAAKSRLAYLEHLAAGGSPKPLLEDRRDPLQLSFEDCSYSTPSNASSPGFTVDLCLPDRLGVKLLRLCRIIRPWQKL